MRSTDILIVDDEVGIRDLLSEILQDEGYTVTEAEDAETARQLRNQTRPAMVLLIFGCQIVMALLCLKSGHNRDS